MNTVKKTYDLSNFCFLFFSTVLHWACSIALLAIKKSWWQIYFSCRRSWRRCRFRSHSQRLHPPLLLRLQIFLLSFNVARATKWKFNFVMEAHVTRESA